MQNYFRPLDPIQWKQRKTHIFTILGSKGKPLENFTFDLDVPKLILLGEHEEQWIWKSHTHLLMTQTTPLDDSSHDLDTPKCELWNGWSLSSHYLSLSLEVEDKISLKVMETLTSMGVFMGFPY